MSSVKDQFTLQVTIHPDKPLTRWERDNLINSIGKALHNYEDIAFVFDIEEAKN